MINKFNTFRNRLSTFENMDPLIRNYTKSEIPLDRMIYLIYLYNDFGVGYNIELSNVCNIDEFPELTEYIESDGCFDDRILSDMPQLVSKLSKGEKLNIKELFHGINNEYNIEKVVTFNEIKEYLFGLTDIGVGIEYEDLSDDHKIIFSRSKLKEYPFSKLQPPIDGVGYPVTELQIKFYTKNSASYFKFTDELQTLMERLGDDYNTELVLKPVIGRALGDYILYQIGITRK